MAKMTEEEVWFWQKVLFTLAENTEKEGILGKRQEEVLILVEKGKPEGDKSWPF